MPLHVISLKLHIDQSWTHRFLPYRPFTFRLHCAMVALSMVFSVFNLGLRARIRSPFTERFFIWFLPSKLYLHVVFLWRMNGSWMLKNNFDWLKLWQNSALNLHNGGYRLIKIIKVVLKCEFYLSPCATLLSTWFQSTFEMTD